MMTRGSRRPRKGAFFESLMGTVPFNDFDNTSGSYPGELNP